jgi:4-hydroxy-tetrahydrodipicolinate reductase
VITNTTDIVVAGLTGRMGTLIAGLAHREPAFRLVGATVREGTYAVGEDVGAHIGAGLLEVEIATDLDHALSRVPTPSSTVVIDFTAPHALAHHLKSCRKARVPIVVGTTGLTQAEQTLLDEAARDIPVLQANNTSLGANLMFALARMSARALPDADVEIVELHHRAKKDAPSGTAISIGKAVADGRNVSFDDAKVYAREGFAPRKDGEIGLFAVRGGGVVGEHTAYFFLDKERIELTHRVADRAIFAQGALVAARHLCGKPPRRYVMNDVLGLGDLT